MWSERSIQLVEHPITERSVEFQKFNSKILVNLIKEEFTFGNLPILENRIL